MVHSKELREVLEQQPTPQITEQLRNLEALGMDSDLFQQFQKKVGGILSANEGVYDIVESELHKASLSIETLYAGYERQFRSVLEINANNVPASNDETFDDV